MTAKEYLNRYRSINYTIDAKLEQVARLRALATRVTPSYGGRKSNGSTSDRVGHILAGIERLEQEVNREIDRLISAAAEIRATISLLPDEHMRELLEMRYINGWSWRKIAAKMNYSEKHLIGYLHKRALEEIDLILAKVNTS